MPRITVFMLALIGLLWIGAADAAPRQDPSSAIHFAEALLYGDDRDRSRLHVENVRELLRAETAARTRSRGQAYQLLGALGALEGDFPGALEDYRRAEQAFLAEGDHGLAYDMRRGQAVALALAGRYEEAEQLDLRTPLCADGEACSLVAALSSCRESLRLIDGNQAFWGAGLEQVGPSSGCSARAAVAIAGLAERQGRADLVKPFLGLARFGAKRRRYEAGDAEDLIQLASSPSPDGASQENQDFLRGAAVPDMSETAPVRTAQQQQALRSTISGNLAFFGRLAQGSAYQDSMLSRPFQGAFSLYQQSRLISLQQLEARDLAAAEEFSDLALHFASRAFAPNLPLRTDFGPAASQCPPGRRAAPECHAWEREAIARYASPQVAALLAERATLEWAQGRDAAALEVIGLSESVVKNWLRSNWTSTDDVVEEFHAMQPRDGELLRVLDAVRRRDPRLADAAARQAFEIAQRQQFNEIDAGVRSALVRARISDPRTTQLWQERQTLSRELADLERGTPAYARVSARLSAADAGLGFSPSALERQAGFRMSAAREIQARLAQDEVLVVIVPADTHTDIFVATSERIGWRVSPRSSDWIQDHVRRLRDHLTVRSSRGFPRAVAYALYQELLAPSEVEIGDKRILLSTSGVLDRFPITALVTRPPAGSDLDSAALTATPWLGVRNSVVVVPSLELIVTRDHSAVTARQGLAAFANPVLPQAQVAEYEVRSGAMLGPLANAELEVRALGRIVPGPKTVLTGAQATEGALRRADLRNLRVLAFATHGLAEGEHGQGAEPGLLLTPVSGASDDDGFLSASEAAQLSIGADIVLLSACNTASPREEGGSGLTGLALSFIFAGGRTIMATHWPVADDAAAALVTGVISNARTTRATDIADALKTEMRRFATGTRRPTDSDPRFWAPFIVVGA